MKVSLVILLRVLEVILYVNGEASGDGVKELLIFTSDDGEKAKDIIDCAGDEVVTCKTVEVHFGALEEQTIKLPGELIVEKQRILQEKKTWNGSKSVAFNNSDGGEAVFTYRGSNAFGYVEYPDGEIYVVQNCGDSCHVWIKTNGTRWPDEDPTVEINVKTEDDEEQDDEELRSLISRGKSDRSTIVTYSVMIYYTPEFKSTTPDIPTFVDQMIAETNQGYINSNIPVRVKPHCILPTTLHDNNNGGQMLSQFQNWKSKDELLNSADAAALLVNKFEYCGIGNLAGYKYKSTFTVTMKSCALGHFTFGHELGHNMGAHHDKANANNQHFSFGYGKHIGPPNLGGPGYRSIMAYRATGYGSKANYYSNPSVSYRGYTTGSSTENNARVITENRFLFAAVGDESKNCNGVGGGGGGSGGCSPKPDTYSGDCSKYVWACTDSRYPWFKEACSTTCKYCSTSSPVNGKWSSWSSWSSCSVTCDSGTRRRSRSCTNPAPSHGGTSCSGVSSQTKTCKEAACGSACKVISGAAAGKSCIFPFKWSATGKTYNECAYEPSKGDEYPWCSTKVDDSGTHVSGGGHWGKCDPDNCPGAGSSSCSYSDKHTNCAMWKDPHCTSGEFVSWMMTNCAKTCKCSEGCNPAPDRYSGDCSAYVWACTDSRYSWFKEVCSTTCNYCVSSSASSAECRPAADTYSGDCSAYTWACTDGRYPWFKKVCATTCKYCP